MSYHIITKTTHTGPRLVAQIKLPDRKWRQFQTWKTDKGEAEEVAQGIEKAIWQGTPPDMFCQRKQRAVQEEARRCRVKEQLEAYFDEKYSTWAGATLPGYRIPLMLFRDFVCDIDVQQVTSKHLLTFRKHLLKRGCTRQPQGQKEWRPLQPKTLRNYEDAVRFFLNWCGRRLNFVPPTITRIPVPKPQAVRYWSPDDCVDLLRAAAGIIVHGQPFSLYMGFLFSTGMRKTEAALVEWDWVDLEKRSIILPGRHPQTQARITKNGRWRLIPIPDRLCEVLLAWPSPRTGRLFQMSIDSGRIADNFERAIIRANDQRLAEGKPLIPRLTPHSTRHTYAVQSLQAGMDLFALAQILGHSSTDTTMKHYAMLAGPELHRQLAKAASYHEALSRGLGGPASSS